MGRVFSVAPNNGDNKINIAISIYNFNVLAYSAWAWENKKCVRDLWEPGLRSRFWAEKTTRFLLLLMRIQLDNKDNLTLWVFSYRKLIPVDYFMNPPLKLDGAFSTQERLEEVL